MLSVRDAGGVLPARVAAIAAVLFALGGCGSVDSDQSSAESDGTGSMAPSVSRSTPGTAVDLPEGWTRYKVPKEDLVVGVPFEWKPADLPAMRAWAADNLSRDPTGRQAVGLRRIVRMIDSGTLVLSVEGPASGGYTASIDVELLPGTDSDKLAVKARQRRSLHDRLLGPAVALSQRRLDVPIGGGIRLESTRTQVGSTPSRIIAFIVKYGAGHLVVSGATPADDPNFPGLMDDFLENLATR